MHKFLFRRTFIAIAATLLISAVSAEEKANTGINPRITHLTAETARKILQPQWDSYEKSTGKMEGGIFVREPRILLWYLGMTPPFPDHWPPSSTRSFSYYAYGTYSENFHHGPVESVSAPWGRIIVRDEYAPAAIIYSNVIGPSVTGRGSRLIGQEVAKRLNELRAGEKQIPTLLRWTALPDPRERDTLLPMGPRMEPFFQDIHSGKPSRFFSMVELSKI
jgi:hypothetical protein